MYQFILPDAGEGTHEAEVLAWHVKVGDKVIEDQIILEIQSDKAAVELPSPVSGTVVKLYAQEGEIALVGKPIADIETEKDQDSQEHTHEAKKINHSEEKDIVDSEQKSEDDKMPGSSSSISNDIRKIAIPRVRKYARIKNVDLSKVKGTGNHGKITIEDIDNFLSTDHPSETIEEPPITKDSQFIIQSESEMQRKAPELSRVLEEDRVEKLSAMRKVIAKSMVESKQISPHVTVFDQVEVSELVMHRNRMKVIAENKGIKLTYSAYFVKALVAMLKRFPELNASISLQKGEMYYHNYYNIGVATDTPNGLVVPMLRNAERMSLFEIAKEIQAKAEKAQKGGLDSSEMGKGSITLTNVGGMATGGVWSTPIINQPEVAILGVGRIEEQFLPDEEKNPVLKPVLKISFAFDHRVVDGVTAQKAINLIKEYLNNPDLLLSEG
ncbi:dihydrolipoamide acetyltransferase family protein [Facklamia miroungae]|uniref:Dihydrolipoamide acetyltransferase component of pyruvate dehydrogenase complex n=1 Tax=Facklamia miroungae TaxID=120956 RepID=A0A1G7T956_9LACT|nr:dihydrolipoamide acetyltransferase family protein [Facklamia miroungae]NKZ29713.1 2-oxo acid dehydrogenase subunit E2 [Facklamia miroungae]SDG31612.1 pyruvate dehydrogenase E2 component (dihydrolipoamide acetyltransferase) [Facklamia miroungae]